MIERALEAGVPAKRATGDAVYGQHSSLRRTLEGRGLHYVLAVPVNQRVNAKAGLLGTEYRANELIVSLSAERFWFRKLNRPGFGRDIFMWRPVPERGWLVYCSGLLRTPRAGSCPGARVGGGC